MNEISRLYQYIRKNGGVPAWAIRLNMKTSTLYAKLRGIRRLFPEEAELIERETNRRFRKERLIFRKAAA